MREKKRCRWLALLLAVVMVLSVLPTAVFAVGDTSNDEFYKIVHVDCGRKYFSPENIKKIIDNAEKAGFNQVELYLSDNQGFRFALDNMNVTTSTGNTYDLTPALGDGYSDGSKYPDGSGKYLTQSEMTDIISYATDKGIDIVPCINVPGHMGAILEKFTSFRYTKGSQTSKSSIDLDNDEAVAFALAITKKYVDYFKTQDVKFYNIGADEYANDLSSMGFEGMGSTLYTKFVEFLNSAAAIVINAGMTPRAFNDGFLYKDYSVPVTPNKAFEICYWTSGWDGYDVASAETLNNAGYKLINTHGDYYWVLGNTSWQCSAEKASGFNYTSFQGGTISDPAGAMFCIWCDVGNANGKDGGTAVVSATADVIAAFGAALPASESGGSEGGETEPTDPTEPVEVTENETITVTVGQTATATISGYNFAGTYTTEDPSIATVEVTGVDGTEATTTYTQASVFCNTLISSSSDNWTAVSGYYYTPDGANYYLVYAKRSISWGKYTYTWGYSTTSSTSNVTQIGTQSTYIPSYTTPNITVYTKTETAGTPASTTVTFNGLKVGTTYVTVGNTRYTINVVAEDLSKVTPLTVEFWITNRQVTVNGATSMTIQANASNVYSVTGALISSLVPATGTLDSNTMAFWKATCLDSDNNQTTTAGVDKTNSGTDFIYIRYWEGSWAYSADGKNWTNVVNGDQIVAYYMQKTEVTDEVTTEVVDWGVIPSTNYNSTNFVLLDFAVKYESGELVPSSFPVSGKTMAFHCDPSDTNTVHQYNNESKNSWYNNYRDINRIMAVATTDYEVYMITVTPTNDSNSTQVASNANTATSYTYGGTEKVIWVDDEANLGDFADESLHYTSISGKYSYSVGGEAALPGLEIFNRHGMLVTYYVRAKVTEDSLSVHYVDQKTNDEFYSYNIAVKSGTVFNENIGLADPWKGNLANGSVTNLQDKTQTVSTDLSTMPAIGAQYSYSDYTCVKVVRSEDGKEVSLYYTFNHAKTFVIDFGLPLKITKDDLNISGEWTSATVTDAEYGTVDATVGDGVTYTPTKVLTGVETLQLTLTGTNGSVTHQIYIYPASNVLYEAEKFTTAGNAWTATVKYDDTANSCWDCLEDYLNTVYGYTEEYASSVGAGKGGGVYAVLSKNQFTDDLSFSFKGTGFDLIAQCGATTGTLMVRVDNSKGYYKSYLVDTSFSDQNIVDGNGYIYQVPVIHAQDWPEDTYTVTVRGANIVYGAASNSNANTASTFSMRSAGASAMDTIYALADRMGLSGDDLDSMEFINVDQLYGASTYAMASAVRTASTDTADTQADATMTLGIDAFRVYRDTSNSAYKTGEKGMVYVNVLDAVANGDKGVYVTSYTENGTEQYEISEYEGLGGPENELYLPKGASVTFNVESAEYIQASLRAVAGTTSWNKTSISSNTEMYYSLTAQEQGKYVIVNTGDNLLAIGNLKTNGTVTIVSEELKSKALSLTRMMMAAASEPDPEQPGTEEPEPTPAPVFEPDKFELRTSSIRTRNRRIVTLMITASTDVDHVVVNGKTYYPMNKLLVKWGLSKTYVFTIMDTAGASETRSFEIVAYNADGLASSTYTDAG